MHLVRKAAILALLFGGGIAACRRAAAPSPTANRPAAAVASTAAAEPATVPASFAPPSCSIRVESPQRASVGKPGFAQVTMRSFHGYHVNQDAPIEVVVASRDVDVPQGKLGLGDATYLAPELIRMDVPFTAHARGEKHISVHARFGICTTTKCSECREDSELVTVVD